VRRSFCGIRVDAIGVLLGKENAMGDYENCIKKTYAKLYYIPPTKPGRPVDCKKVKFTKSPEVALMPGGRGDYRKVMGLRPGDSIGIDFHWADPLTPCVAPSTVGAGGVIVLLQISACIEAEVEFTSSSSLQEALLLGYSPAPRVVREMHRVYVSLPMLYKVPGPRIALMSMSPAWIKLGAYATLIGKAFLEMRQVEQAMEKVLALKEGLCPEDIRALELGLNKLETEFNSRLEHAILSPDDLASSMSRAVDGTARFVGSRVA
jgi:hypothetical protein